MSDRPDEEESESFDYELLSRVVRRNDTQTLERFLKAAQTKGTLLPANSRGETVLHLAASKPEYKECLALLLQHGVGVLDLDAQTGAGTTALYVATAQGLDESVLLLLQAGCNPNLYHARWFSSLILAILRGYSKIVEYLLNFGVDKTYSLQVAAREQHMDICRMLLEKGAIMEVNESGGEIPLHEILKAPNTDTSFVWNYVDFSLLNHRDHAGITPFMRAAEHADAEYVRHLLENGGRTDLYDDSGLAALHYAARSGRVETLQLLLQRTDLSDYKSFCLNRLKSLSDSKNHFISLINCPFEYRDPIERLNLLLTSELPSSILQMPSTVYDTFSWDRPIVVYSPLARLLSRLGGGSFDAEFNELLQLLMKHKILLLNEFRLEFQFNWPQNTSFRHPFDSLIETSNRSGRVTEECMRIFNLLYANGVTTDYCLQGYHENTQPFATFTAYYPYYSSVLIEVKFGNVEAVKLLLSNSVILEPDKLLIDSPKHKIFEHGEPEQGSYDMYQYLISLKPIYYMRRQVQRDCQSNFWPYLEHDTDEFTRVTLQQLCRTAVREQLREPSLEDNLRNFRKKIFDLPLPNILKDYLVFKC